MLVAGHVGDGDAEQAGLLVVKQQLVSAAVQTDSVVLLTPDEASRQECREKELVKVQASRDAAMRMIERFQASESNSVSALKFDEVNRALRELETRYAALAADHDALLAEQGESAGSAREEEYEEDGEPDLVPRGGCELCCGALGDSDVMMGCDAGCGARAHARCIQKGVNLGRNRDYVQLRGGWLQAASGCFCTSCR